MKTKKSKELGALSNQLQEVWEPWQLEKPDERVGVCLLGERNRGTTNTYTISANGDTNLTLNLVAVFIQAIANQLKVPFEKLLDTLKEGGTDERGEEF